MGNNKDNSRPTQMAGQLGKMLLAAAMSMPAMQAAQADTAPERGMVGFKYLDYRDWQSGQDRIAVTAPALSFLLPIGEQWSIDGSVVTDSVSGASPVFYSTNFGHMKDTRHGKNLAVTRYFSRGSVTLGGAYSSESDYLSRAYSLTANISSEDKNTTLNFGVGATNDEINPSNLTVVGEQKNSNEMMLGLTQVLSQTDIAQINLTHSRGRGYFTDPYKHGVESRPERKNQSAVLLRWNHHFQELDGTSRLSYRYYKDSFGIRSHTVTGEYVQALPFGWTLTPQLRLYSQTAANFYLEPVDRTTLTLPDGYVFGQLLSVDQRLAAFGALSYGFKVAKQIDRDWLVDFKYEKYEQRNAWAISGNSKDLDTLHARIFQVGLSYFF